MNKKKIFKKLMKNSNIQKNFFFELNKGSIDLKIMILQISISKDYKKEQNT